jgi:hypothetical protein
LTALNQTKISQPEHMPSGTTVRRGNLDGKQDEGTRFIAVLEIAPVESAEAAVRVQIVKDVKAKNK